MKLHEILNTIDPKLQLHDELNFDLWVNSKLKLIVSKTLKNIANKFFAYLDIDRKSILEVVMTGSNCNYNYTPQSDIDLHIIIDFEVLNITPEEFIEKYFKAAKTLWNQEHDIKIGDYDVELYAQDSKENHIAAGVYSLTNDSWIKKPEKVHIKIDDMSVKAKALEIARQIDSLVDYNGDDPDPAKELKNKIKKMRQSGLSTGGEMSTENLSFKALRNNGYLAKLDKVYKGIVDKELSLSNSDLNEV